MPSGKSTVWWRQSSELLREETHTLHFMTKNKQQKTLRIYILVRIVRTEFAAFGKNRERIQTLSPALEWEERRGPREGNTQKTPLAPPTTTKETRAFALSAALTHLHEELPLLHQGLASLAALLDHPAARHTCKHKAERRKTVTSAVSGCCCNRRKKPCVLSEDELNIAHLLHLLHVQGSVSHLPAALCPTENRGSFEPQPKCQDWNRRLVSHIWQSDVRRRDCRLTRLAVCDISTVCCFSEGMRPAEPSVKMTNAHSSSSSGSSMKVNKTQLFFPYSFIFQDLWMNKELFPVFQRRLPGFFSLPFFIFFTLSHWSFWAISFIRWIFLKNSFYSMIPPLICFHYLSLWASLWTAKQ